MKIIDWPWIAFNSPPLLRHLTDSALLEAIETGAIELDGIPDHAQALERTVQMATRAAKKVVEQDGRDGNIVQTIHARRAHPDKQKP
ncbi:hypothetical protein Ciccas_010770, partial [Cichlidogyrus casuarinus]